MKHKLPAIEVEIPRMGNVVYVSPLIGVQDEKNTCMFTAEIIVNGNKELQSFHLKCKNMKEAIKTSEEMIARLKELGSYPFIQHSL